jgi:hypothetical protein
MALRFQNGFFFKIIVEFPVVSHNHAGFLIHPGLISMFQVNDRKTGMSESQLIVIRPMETLGVWTSMNYCIQCGGKKFSIRQSPVF